MEPPQNLNTSSLCLPAHPDMISSNMKTSHRDQSNLSPSVSGIRHPAIPTIDEELSELYHVVPDRLTTG